MYIRLAATDGVAEPWPRKVACLDLGTWFPHCINTTYIYDNRLLVEQ